MVRNSAPAPWRGCLALVLFLFLWSGMAPASVAIPVEGVTFTHRPDGTGLLVRIHASEPIQAFREPIVTPGQGVELVVFNAELAPSYVAQQPVSPVQRLQVDPQRNHLRFTFDLEPGVRVKASAYRDRETADLLLGIEYQSTVAAPLPVTSLPERPVRLPNGRRVGATPGGSGSESAAAMRWRLDTIVIDAGHGGHDQGAVSNGILEKDVCLAVARKLGRRIEEELGARVVYTRTTDRFVALKERGRIANEAGGKLFISLHANAAHSASAAGTETFFLGMHKSDAARDVMERENSVVELEDDPTHYRAMTDESIILQTLAHSAFMRKSEELASLVEDELGTHAPGRSRGVKQAGFYVLWSASMPAILVEMGFLTNRREASFLSSEDGQEYVASAILRAVQTFKERYERDLHLVSP